MEPMPRPTADEATFAPPRGDGDGNVDVSPETVDAFVRLLGQNQRRIFLYVMSLVPDWNDAEEIIQETNLVLWREFARFQPGTNFAAWACKVALHRVLAWRKRVRRDRLEFSPAFLEAVADEASAASDLLEERTQGLARCIERLPADHRRLLRLRYSDGLAIEAIARQLERTEDAVYRALSRIRRALHECVTRSRLLKGRS
jgi:RNA polymerase sigma-70 factor (ECF subfamily)